jgi:O-antigen ligase
MKNKTLWFIAALVLLIGCASGLFTVSQQAASLNRGWEIATNPDSQLPFATPHAGINVDLLQYDPDGQLQDELAAIASLGFRWVRQPFNWAEIEQNPGAYDWAAWDAIIDAVEAIPELELVAVLQTTPTWARPTDAAAVDTAPPSQLEIFGEFSGAFAARYGNSIDYYQIWDEPNLASGWGDMPPKAADYVALLQQGYTAIHAVDSTATVIAAGLAPTTETGPLNYSDTLFLTAIYENGGQTYFDAVAGKPYGFTATPNDRQTTEATLNFSRLILLREIMQAYGDAEKPVWASHFGWNALSEDWQSEPSIWGSVSREEQLQYVREAYSRVEREWPWAGGVILQHWDPDTDDTDPMQGFALRRDDLDTLETDAITGVDAAAAPPGRHHPTTSYAEYAGEWAFSELGADFGQNNDSEVTFTFEGTDIALELRRDNYRAYLYAEIDGLPANALPVDGEGRSYLVLTSDDLAPHIDVVTIATGLESGIHTLHLRADRGWDQWALAAFRVAQRPPDKPYQVLKWLFGIGMLGALAGIIGFGRQIPRSTLPNWLAAVRSSLGQAADILLAGAASLILMVGMLLTWQNTLPALVRRDPPGIIIGILTAGLVYLSPSLLITVSAALLLALLIYQRLELGLMLTLFWAPFFLFPVELYQWAFPMAEVCVLITAAAWIMHQLVNRAKAYRSKTAGNIFNLWRNFNTLDWGMLALFVLASLSLTWAAHRPEALREWRTVILEPMLFYVMVRTTIHQPDEIVRLVSAFILSAVTAAVISLGMYFTGQGVITAEGGTLRLAGIYGSPNNMGLLLDRALPFVLALLLFARSYRWRILWAVSGAILIGTAVLSQSVGAIILGIPAGFLLVLALWHFRRAIVITILTGIAGIIAMIPLSQHPRVAQLLDFSSGTSFFRLRLWQSAIQMIQDNPIRGFGLDQFLYLYRGHYILPEAWQEPNLSHPHNFLLDFWIRLGAGGILIFGWLQVHFWRLSWAIYRDSNQSRIMHTFIVGAMGSMAAIVAHGLVDNSVFVIDLSYIFALLIALPGQIAASKVDANP